MNNATSVKIPRKYESMIDVIEKDSEGYWAYSKKGFCFGGMDSRGCHTAHEYTQAELLKMVRSLKTCDCDHCKE